MNTKSNIKPLLILVLVVLLSRNSNIAQNVGIGSTSFTPDASAGLEIRYTDKGFLPPRMTTEQRDEIQYPAEGLQIFNTTTKCVEVFAYGIWQQIFCAICPVPNAPFAGTHVPSETEIVWNWNSSAGADGYKWHTTNNYAAATDLGNNTTVIQTGLTCNTPYTIYVWAYNACGNSDVLTLTQTTSACPICDVPSVTFTYKGQSVTYGTVESSGKCWLDRNLGASQVATSSTDANAYGDLFQWGRRDDGHQNRNSTVTSSISNIDQPLHGDFIRNQNAPYDWRSPQNGNLWQGVNGINNPCPAGWRVPTQQEWNTERSSWANQKTADDAFNSPLKLTIGGTRSGWNGNISFFDGPAFGRYWSSSAWCCFNGNGMAERLNIRTDGSQTQETYRMDGLSVRCIKD